MITVKATREGLVGGKTSTGYKVEKEVPFVALPSVAALRQWVKIYNRKTGKSCRALVLDVGPWNENDHAYVFQPATLNRDGTPPQDEAKGIRPTAETGVDTRGRVTNSAGIDLGEKVWELLGLPGLGGSATVSWEFD